MTKILATLLSIVLLTGIAWADPVANPTTPPRASQKKPTKAQKKALKRPPPPRRPPLPSHQPVPPQRPNPAAMQFQALKFTIPKAERVVLSNGTIVYLLEDHELPVVHVFSLTRTGSEYEPADKSGLAEMTGAVMRTGGTLTRTGDQMDEDLAFIAASVTSAIGQQAGSTTVTALTKYFDKAFEMWVDMLRNPVFAEDKVRLYRSQMLETIRRQDDNPREIARREFRHLLYKDHPLGRNATAATVNRLSRQDLLDFYNRYYHPDNLIVGVVGDFDKAAMLGKLEQAFKGWSKVASKIPDVPEVKYEWQPGINYIYKNIPQSSIRLGHAGVQQSNPDYYALVVMNDILGGGGVFTNRLMKEIRSNRGLVYGVGSFFTTPSREIGMFGEAADTKSSSTAQVLQLMEDITRSVIAGPVGDEELQRAKDGILNSFVFEFSSSSQVVWRQMNLEYDGLPPDYLDNYAAHIARVTAADVLRVAKQYLHPDRLIVLVVGNARDFDKPLTTFGPVNEIVLPEAGKAK